MTHIFTDADGTQEGQLTIGQSLRWVVCWEPGRQAPRKLLDNRGCPGTNTEWDEIYSLVLVLRGAVETGGKYAIVIAREDDCLFTLLNDDDLPWMTVAVDRAAGFIPGAELAGLVAAYHRKTGGKRSAAAPSPSLIGSFSRAEDTPRC